MSEVTVTTEEKKKIRKEYEMVCPFDVEMDESGRGRTSQIPEEKIVELAESFMSKDGQLTPVCARRTKVGGETKTVLVYGFSRTEAARRVVKGFVNRSGQHCQDENFKLKVMIAANISEEDAFRRNIIENLMRENTNDLDDAENQEKLRDKWGWEDYQVIDLYKYTNMTRYNALKKLLQCERNVREMVRDKKMSLQAAIDLLDVDSSKRQEIIEAATKDNGKVNGAVVKGIITEEAATKAEVTPPKEEETEKVTNPDGEVIVVKPKKNGRGRKKSNFKARSLKSIKDTIEDLRLDIPVDCPTVKIANSILAYMRGETGTEQFMKFMMTLDIMDAPVYVAPVCE